VGKDIDTLYELALDIINDIKPEDIERMYMNDNISWPNGTKTAKNWEDFIQAGPAIVEMLSMTKLLVKKVPDLSDEMKTHITESAIFVQRWTLDWYKYLAAWLAKTVLTGNEEG